MKKYTLFILVFIFCLLLSGCKQKKVALTYDYGEKIHIDQLTDDYKSNGGSGRIRYIMIESNNPLQNSCSTYIENTEIIQLHDEYIECISVGQTNIIFKEYWKEYIIEIIVK